MEYFLCFASEEAETVNFERAAMHITLTLIQTCFRGLHPRHEYGYSLFITSSVCLAQADRQDDSISCRFPAAVQAYA
jgi:hypothetical protein